MAQEVPELVYQGFQELLKFPQISQIKGTLDCSSVGSLSQSRHGLLLIPWFLILKEIPGIVTIVGFRISKKFSSYLQKKRGGGVNFSPPPP